MAVEYGMSLISELKEVLSRRKNVLDIFGTYKIMYDELLQELATTCKTDVDTAVTAFYLSNHIMDRVQTEEARDRLNENERVKIILENLLEARKHLKKDFESIIQIYSLIYDWAIKIEKNLIQDARLLIGKKVIITNIVDIFAVPLFSFLAKILPALDLRWAMAELAGALNNNFALEFYEGYKKKFPFNTMDSQNYFDAGYFVIEPYVKDYFEKKFTDGFEKLESFGDIGRKIYEYAIMICYEKEKRNLYGRIAFDDQIKSDERLEKELINSLYINHSKKMPEIPFRLLFAKYFVKIKTKGQASQERYFYIQNFEEQEGNLGIWNYLILSSENLNLESLMSYTKQRCTDIRGIKNHYENLGELDEESLNNLLASWMEMYISNLQMEYNFLEMKDKRREQNFIPIGLINQKKEQNFVELLVETPKAISSMRMETLGIKSSLISIEQVLKITDHVKNFSDHVFNILRYILLQQSSNIEITFSPLELLYENRNYPSKNLLLLFSSDDSRLLGLICANEATLEFQARAMKSRQILGKLNQLLTELRIKTLEDARIAKLDEYIKNSVSKIYEIGNLNIKGNIIDIEKDISITNNTLPKENIIDRLEIAKQLEEERSNDLKLLEIERTETIEKEKYIRLKALQTVFFNERILKIIYEKYSLNFQMKLLNYLEEKFPEYFGLNNEYHKVKMNMKDLEKIIENQENGTKEINDYFDEIISDADNLNIKDLIGIKTQLEDIWKIITNITEEHLLEQ